MVYIILPPMFCVVYLNANNVKHGNTDWIQNELLKDRMQMAMTLEGARHLSRL